MKKTLFTIALFFLLTCVLAVGASAASETEPNNTAQTATEIEIGEVVTGNITPRNEEDWYKFTIPQDGYFHVEFNHELWDSNTTYWSLSLYDSTGASYIDGKSSNYYVAAKDNLKTFQYGVSAGTYYIKVERNTHSDKQYELCVKFTAADNWETEVNNTKDKADEIGINQTYYGALTKEDEQDWYKFTIPEQGYFCVVFEHELFDKSTTYWEMRLYDSTGTKFIDGNDSYYSVAGNGNKTTYHFGVEAGTYYLKVSEVSHCSDTYSICVKFTAAADWETENNNTKDTADALTLNRPLHGAFSTNGDVDWYKFTITERGYFKVTFEHELWEKSDAYWHLRLFDETAVNQIDGTDGYYGITGEANRTTYTYGIEPGTYYVKLNKSSYSGKDYSICVEFTAAIDWETENNNTKANADTIQAGKLYYGAMTNTDDVDWYSFTLNHQAEIAVSLTHEAWDSNNAFWIVTLYDKDGVTKLTSFNCKASAGTVTGEYQTLSPGTYYIKITDSSFAGRPYTLNVSEKHDCHGTFVTVDFPTCTQDGVQESHCTICGKLLETKAAPALGHQSDNWIVDAPASCDREGLRHGECRLCHENVSESIPMLPHTLGEAVQASGSKLIPPIVMEQTCSVCGHVEQTKDWSYVWIPILVLIGAVAVVIGLISYAKAFKKK